MNKKKRASLIFYLSSIAGLVFFFLVWWIISLVMYGQGNRLLPYPNDVFMTLLRVLFETEYAKNTYEAIGWTLLRLLIGFASSFLLAAMLGTLGALHKAFEGFMKPFVIFCRSVPTAAVVLILCALFTSIRGLPTYIPCFLVFLVAFPLVYQAFVDGIKAESPDVKDALSLDGGSKSLSSVVHVLWPDSQDYLFLALAQGLGLSMKVSVMSEIICDSSRAKMGIGVLISNANMYLSMNEVIAYSLIAVILIAIMDIPLLLAKKKLKEDNGH